MQSSWKTIALAVLLVTAVWACGVEKGGASKDISEPAAAETTIAPSLENNITALKGLVAGKSFEVTSAWIPDGETEIYFSNTETTGCNDDTVTFLFKMTGLPEDVGVTTDLASVSLISGASPDPVTGFEGSLEILRSTLTDLDGILNVTIPALEESEPYNLKGSFVAIKCMGASTGSDDTTDDGETEGEDDSGEDEIDPLYGNWATECITTKRQRIHLNLKDTNTFTMNTYLYQDANCANLEIIHQRTGTMGSAEALVVGKSLDMSYSSSSITIVDSNEVPLANTHSYASPTVLPSIGLCGIQDWVVDTARDVSTVINCFPYDSTVAHATRIDKLSYQISGDALQMSDIDDPIYETQSRANSDVRSPDFVLTFTAGAVETQ